MGPTMRTEEVTVLEERLHRRFSLLLLRYVVPSFAVLVIGVAVAVGMIMHGARIDKYDRCSDGVEGRAVTRGLFIAVADGLRASGSEQGAIFIETIVNEKRPVEDKQTICGPPPNWWDV